jgi:hypothetical protein
MKYVIVLGSGAVITTQSCIKIGSGIQKLMVGRGDIQTHRQHDDLVKTTFIF